MTVRTLLAGLIAIVAAGCAVGPDYRRPPIETAPAFVEAPPNAAAPAPATPDGKTVEKTAATPGEEDADRAWWLSFGDPLLANLVEKAITSSPRSREAMARLREARALRAGAVGTLFPKIDGEAGYNHSRLSEHGFLESLATGGGTGSGGAVFPGQEINLFQTGFDAQWEIDLFGHVRRSVEAAGDEVKASEAEAADVARSLAAETAREVVEIRSLDERVAIAEANIESERETLEILRQRRAAGIASEADVARTDGQLAAIEAEVPALRSRRAAALHRLEALVAVVPGSLDADFAAARALPAPASLPPPGLPSDLLLRRPDVARAEQELAAATARVGVAKAELLPRFSLSGSFGVQSQHIDDLLTADSRFWYVGPGLRWPIFDAGRLCAAVKAADAKTQQAAARYEIAVRTAIAEVETALSSLAREREREQELDRGAKDEALAAGATRDLYTSGLTDLLHVLDAQRARYRAEDALAVSRQALSEDAIVLYKALGGGWKAAS